MSLYVLIANQRSVPSFSSQSTTNNPPHRHPLTFASEPALHQTTLSDLRQRIAPFFHPTTLPSEVKVSFGGATMRSERATMAAYGIADGSLLRASLLLSTPTSSTSTSTTHTKASAPNRNNSASKEDQRQTLFRRIRALETDAWHTASAEADALERDLPSIACPSSSSDGIYEGGTPERGGDRKRWEERRDRAGLGLERAILALDAVDLPSDVPELRQERRRAITGLQALSLRLDQLQLTPSEGV